MPLGEREKKKVQSKYLDIGKYWRMTLFKQVVSSPPSLTEPQPVTQLSVPLMNTLPLAAKHTGLIKSVNVTGEESLSRAMSLSLASLS